MKVELPAEWNKWLEGLDQRVDPRVRTFSAAEDELIRRAFKKAPKAELAKKLRISMGTLLKRINDLGLNKE